MGLRKPWKTITFPSGPIFSSCRNGNGVPECHNRDRFTLSNTSGKSKARYRDQPVCKSSV